MRSKAADGTWYDTDDWENWCSKEAYGGKLELISKPESDVHGEMKCTCGSVNFKVRYIPYPWTGCFCETKCILCDRIFTIMDDFS